MEFLAIIATNTIGRTSMRLWPLIAIFFSQSILANCLAVKAPQYFDGNQFHFNNDNYITIKRSTIISISKTYPSNCELKIYKNATIIPGLFDLHSLIFATDETYSTDYARGVLLNSQMSHEKRTLMAKRKLKAYLGAGFTTIRDLGNSGQYLDVELRNSIDKFSYPRLIVSGPGITAVGGQFPKSENFKTVAKEYDQLKDLKRIEELLKNRRNNKVDLVKLYADNEPNPNSLSEKELIKLTNYSRQYGFQTAIHATDKESIQRAINASPTTIEHGFAASLEQLREMKKKNIFLIPTDPGIYLYNKIKNLVPQKYSKQFRLDYPREIRKSTSRLKLAQMAQTPIGFGSDFYFPIDQLGIPFIEGVYSSLFSLRDAGYTISEILKFATSNAAQATKRFDLGRIQKGNVADLLIVHGNLHDDLKNIRNVISVIKNGKENLNKSQ